MLNYISSKKNELYFVYDGECPLCAKAAMAYRLRKKFGMLHLINARDAANDNPVIQDINVRGLDLDAGMVIVHGDMYYHGQEALQFMAWHSASDDIFNMVLKSIFWSKTVSRLTYPLMRSARNWLLKRQKSEHINNLELKKESAN